MAIDHVEVFAHDRAKPKLIVQGIPTLGMIHMRWRYALMGLRHPMNIQVHEYSVWGQTTADARNEIVAHALKANADYVFFVDDDTLPPPDALVKLLSDRRPIVSGLYYGKCSVPQPLLLHGRYAGTALSWTPGDIVECYAHGMGCTLIEANVFVDLAERGAVEQTDQPCPACQGAGCRGCLSTGKGLRWFYTTDEILHAPNGFPLHTTQTEDVYFLERAQAAGYQPAVDTGVFCWHLDVKTGKTYPLKQWAEYSTTGTVSWETDAGTVTWPGVQPA